MYWPNWQAACSLKTTGLMDQSCQAVADMRRRRFAICFNIPDPSLEEEDRGGMN